MKEKRWLVVKQKKKTPAFAGVFSFKAMARFCKKNP